MQPKGDGGDASCEHTAHSSSVVSPEWSSFSSSREHHTNESVSSQDLFSAWPSASGRAAQQAGAGSSGPPPRPGPGEALRENAADLFASSFLGDASGQHSSGLGTPISRGDSASKDAPGGDAASAAPPGALRNQFPCTRLLKCLLASVLHHLEFASSEHGAQSSGSGGIARGSGGGVVAKGCREVLCVAWRLAYCHWTQVSQAPGGDKQDNTEAASVALSLCLEMATAVVEHVMEVAALGKRVLRQVPAVKKGSSLAGESAGQAHVGKLLDVFQSAVDQVLPEVLAGVSSMPPTPLLIEPLAHVYALLEGV
jgi:hypothetical protein